MHQPYMNLYGAPQHSTKEIEQQEVSFHIVNQIR